MALRHNLGSLGLLIAAAALCLAAAPSPAEPADPFAQRPDASPFAIRELLRKGETAELERRIDDWRARKDERRLDDAYWTFTHLPAAESQALDRWREASPGSPTALLAAEYGVRFLWSHAIESLVCTFAVWGSWKLWCRLRRQRPGAPTRPATIRIGGRAHPELPAMVAVLLKSVLGVIVLHHVWHYGLGFSNADWVQNGIDLPITAIALVGAIAYAIGRRLATQELWRIWAVLFPVWNVVYHFAFEGATLEQWPLWVFAHVELLPVYGSLFAYGFGARAIWDEEPLVGAARAPAA